MRITLILLALFMCFSVPAVALDVSPNGPAIVNLSEDAASVIVGNPAHASVALENPRMLIVNAAMPGVTSLTVLGKNGNVIMNEEVVVGGGTKGMIRVRNACINGGNGCEPTKMYSCADGEACHSVYVQGTAINFMRGRR